MKIGVFYLSHAMLGLAELIVCSTREFAWILAEWFWPTVMSLSLTYGSPEALCNKRADAYFGRWSASLMEEFWTLCILVMTVSKAVMVETIFEYWSYTLFVDLENGWGIWTPLLLTNILKRWNFWLQRSKISSKCFVKVILLSKVIPRNFIWGLVRK